MQIFLLNGGDQHGPYSVQQLDAMLQSETITGSELYWHEGCKDWTPVSQFPGFVPPPDTLPVQPPPVPPTTGNPAPAVHPPRKDLSRAQIISGLLVGLGTIVFLALKETGHFASAPTSVPESVTDGVTRVAAPTTGISYDQMMSKMESTFTMSPTPGVKGYDRYQGESRRNLSILEIIGNKSDIRSATLLLGVPQDQPEVLTRNTGLAILFLQACDPEWTDVPKYLQNAFKAIPRTTEKEVSTVRGQNRIAIKQLEEMGMLQFDVRHKDNHE